MAGSEQDRLCGGGGVRLPDPVRAMLRISEIPHCRSLEFPRELSGAGAWVELTGLSSPVLLAG